MVYSSNGIVICVTAATFVFPIIVILTPVPFSVFVHSFIFFTKRCSTGLGLIGTNAAHPRTRTSRLLQIQIIKQPNLLNYIKLKGSYFVHFFCLFIPTTAFFILEISSSLGIFFNFSFLRS